MRVIQSKNANEINAKSTLEHLIFSARKSSSTLTMPVLGGKSFASQNGTNPDQNPVQSWGF